MQSLNDLPEAVVALAYLALLVQSVRYFRRTERGLFSTVAAIFGGLALPLAAMLALATWKLNAVFDAAPAMVLSWIASTVALCRSELATKAAGLQ